MLARLKVTGVDKVTNPDNSVSIIVNFDLLSEETILQSSSLPFPSTHTKDQIQAGLKNHLDNFNKQHEAELAAQNEANAVDQVVNDLTGLEVTPDDITESPATESQTETTEPQVSAEASAQEAQPAATEAETTQ